jgi:alpha-L-rhamnosidase
LPQQSLDESIAYLLYMADQTGTLWENDGAYASCNHGFASHVVHVLYRDVLGVHHVDTVKKAVRLRFADMRLDWCEGVMPVPDGRIELRWRKDNDQLHYQVVVPAGYSLQVENLSKLKLVRAP